MAGSFELAILPICLEGVEDGEYTALLHVSTDAAKLKDKLVKGVYGFQFHAYSICNDLLPISGSSTTVRSAVLSSGRHAFFAAPVDIKYLICLEMPRHAAFYGERLLHMAVQALRSKEIANVDTFDDPRVAAQPLTPPTLVEMVEKNQAQLQTKILATLKILMTVGSPSPRGAPMFTPYFEQSHKSVPPLITEVLTRIRAQISTNGTVAVPPIQAPTHNMGDVRQRRYLEVGCSVWAHHRLYYNNLPEEQFDHVAGSIVLQAAKDFDSETSSSAGMASLGAQQATAAGIQNSNACAFTKSRLMLLGSSYTFTTATGPKKPLGGGLVSSGHVETARLLLTVQRGAWIAAVVLAPTQAPFIGAAFNSIRATLVAGVEYLEQQAPIGIRGVIPRPLLSELRTNGVSTVQAFCVIGRGSRIHTFERAFDLCATTRVCFLAAARNLRRASRLCFAGRPSFTSVEFRTTLGFKKAKTTRLVLLVDHRCNGATVAVLVALPIPKKKNGEGDISNVVLRQLPQTIAAKSW